MVSRQEKRCLVPRTVEKNLIYLAEKLVLAPPPPHLLPRAVGGALGKHKATIACRRSKQAKHTAWLDVRLDLAMSRVVRRLVNCGFKSPSE